MGGLDVIEINRETGEVRLPEVSREDQKKLWAALATDLLEKRWKEGSPLCK